MVSVWSKWTAVALLALGSQQTPAATEFLADVSCPNAGILGTSLFDNVCWSCLFPIRIAGFDALSGDTAAPPDANTSPVCVCGGNLAEGRLPMVGFSLGMWQPTRIMEIVRRPYCFPALGGIKMASTLATAGGELQAGIAGSDELGDEADKLGFWNFHYYSFPLLAILELLDVPTCNVGAFTSLDVMFMGEAFPNWYDDELSFLIQPEAVLFANPVALAALPVDCAAATGGNPIDRLHWAAGCWGSVYPYSGNTLLSSQRVNNASLVSVKALALMSRLGIIERTVGTDALCEMQPMPILKKSQYRMQMMFPVSESGDGAPGGAGGDSTLGGTQVPSVDPAASIGRTCCHPIGMSTLRWGDWRTRPGTGEDFAFLLWQWTDCCIGLTPGS